MRNYIYIILLFIVLLSCSRNVNKNEIITPEITDLYNLLNTKYTNSYADFNKIKGHEVYKDAERLKILSDEILLDIDNKNIDEAKINRLLKEMRSYLPEGDHNLKIQKYLLKDYNYSLLIKTKLQLYRLICLNEIIESHKKSYFQCELIGIRPVANKDSIKLGDVYSANLIPFFTSSEIRPSKLIIENDTLTYNTDKKCFIFKEKPSTKGVIEKNAEIVIERWGETKKIPLVFKYYVK